MDSTGTERRAAPGSGDGVASAIEVAVSAGSKEGSDHVITLRDPKDPDGPTLVFTPAEWEAFVAGVRDGEFDLDESGALVELDSHGRPVRQRAGGDPGDPGAG
jgi:Domain of unknown function (DUF397)